MIRSLTPLIGIVAITILDLVAMVALGIDGTLLIISAAAISGLGGYQVAKLTWKDFLGCIKALRWVKPR